MRRDMRDDLERIFRAAIEAVDPARLTARVASLRRRLSRDGWTLQIVKPAGLKRQILSTSGRARKYGPRLPQPTATSSQKPKRPPTCAILGCGAS